MENSIRRIARSRRDRVFAGVCGGLAGYLGLDPVLVRVLYVALTLLSWGMGIVLYVLAWIIIPLEAETAPIVPRDEPSRNHARRVAGIFIVILGLLALLSTSFGWFNMFTNLRLAGPVALLAIGIALLLWRKEPVATGGETIHGTEGDISSTTGPIPPRAELRRLTRSESGRKIAGVCAGLGRYLDVDPTIIRLLFIAAIFAGGAGIILYLIMWLVVPLKHDATLPGIGT